MAKPYIKLADDVLFKTRYNKWQLIKVRSRERARFFVKNNVAAVLLFLFQGFKIEEAGKKFGFSEKEVHVFLRNLKKHGLVEFTKEPHDSTVKCHGIEPPLDSLNILLTNACNLRCKHCYLKSGRRYGNELTGKEWVKVLKEVRGLGVFEINISGGEPLLHRDFYKVAEFIASVPTFNANLNTNGTRLEPGVERLLARAFTSVQISLDDAVAEKHDAFRGRKGAFEKAVQSIERLTSHGICTNVGFSLTRENFAALDSMVELCERIGVSALRIGFIAEFGRACKSHVQILRPESSGDDFLEQALKKFRELLETKSKLEISPPFRIQDSDKVIHEEKRYICDGDNTQILYIMADGTIMPCDKLPIDKFSLGNVKKDAIGKVWRSKKTKAFKLMSPRQLPKCRDCDYLRICGGACVARAYHTGGSLQSEDWIACTIMQKLHGS